MLLAPYRRHRPRCISLIPAPAHCSGCSVGERLGNQMRLFVPADVSLARRRVPPPRLRPRSHHFTSIRCRNSGAGALWIWSWSVWNFDHRLGLDDLDLEESGVRGTSTLDQAAVEQASPARSSARWPPRPGPLAVSWPRHLAPSVPPRRLLPSAAWSDRDHRGFADRGPNRTLNDEAEQQQPRASLVRRGIGEITPSAKPPGSSARSLLD